MLVTADDAQQLDPSEVWADAVDALRTAGLVALITVAVVFLVILITGVAISKKAGYSGWWGAIAVLVPPLGLILVLLFAVAKWPALKERDEALGVLESHQLTLASHERRAIKELERKQKVEDAARKRMEKAQLERERVEAERQRFAAGAGAGAVSSPAATSTPDSPSSPDTRATAPTPASASHVSAVTDSPVAGKTLVDDAQDVTSAQDVESAAPAAPKRAPRKPKAGS